MSTANVMIQAATTRFAAAGITPQPRATRSTAIRADASPSQKEQFELAHRALLAEQNQRFVAHALWGDDTRVWWRQQQRPLRLKPAILYRSSIS